MQEQAGDVEPASFMTMNLPASAAPTVQSPAVTDEEAEPGFMTVTLPAQSAEAAYENTLADLGDRLSWLNGLVEEIQEQATTSGATNTRLHEIAHMMGESMSEALALHRSLHDQHQQHQQQAAEK